MSKLPRRGEEYSFEELLQLTLDDDANLSFVHEGLNAVIQSTHITDAELLSVPGFSQTRWRYIRTTSEWIPIFHAVDSEEVLKCVDVEPSACKFTTPHWWATPKGFPREQYVYED